LKNQSTAPGRSLKANPAVSRSQHGFRSSCALLGRLPDAIVLVAPPQTQAKRYFLFILHALIRLTLSFLSFSAVLLSFALIQFLWLLGRLFFLLRCYETKSLVANSTACAQKHDFFLGACYIYVAGATDASVVSLLLLYLFFKLIFYDPSRARPPQTAFQSGRPCLFTHLMRCAVVARVSRNRRGRDAAAAAHSQDQTRLRRACAPALLSGETTVRSTAKEKQSHTPVSWRARLSSACKQRSARLRAARCCSALKAHGHPGLGGSMRGGRAQGRDSTLPRDALRATPQGRVLLLRGPPQYR